MPAVSCRYLLEILYELGPCMAGAMQAVAVTQSEISRWQFNQHRRLSPWEAGVIRRLSAAFVDEMGKATDLDAPSPLEPRMSSAERAAIRMKEQLRKFKKK